MIFFLCVQLPFSPSCFLSVSVSLSFCILFPNAWPNSYSLFENRALRAYRKLHADERRFPTGLEGGLAGPLPWGTTDVGPSRSFLSGDSHSPGETLPVSCLEEDVCAAACVLWRKPPALAFSALSGWDHLLGVPRVRNSCCTLGCRPLAYCWGRGGAGIWLFQVCWVSRCACVLSSCGHQLQTLLKQTNERLAHMSFRKKTFR